MTIPFPSDRSPLRSSVSIPRRASGSEQWRVRLGREGEAFERWVDQHAGLTLIAAYLVTLAFSMVSSSQAFFPRIFPDEAQYAMVGQNLLQHGLFDYRGDFPMLIPPFYSLFVALSRLLAFGTVSIVPIFVINHLLMVGVMFPAYGLARLLKLSRLVALLIALAAPWVPNMWFGNHYMAEAVYYPLFCLVCYLGCRFLLRPDPWSAILTGGAMGAALLTKNTALAPVLAFGIACAWSLGSALVRREFAGGHGNLLGAAKRYLLWPGLALATAGVLYAPWLLMRQHALGGCTQCTGEAGSFSAINLDPGVLAHLLTMYGADIFLSVSALTLLPVLVACAVLLAHASEQQRLGIFLGSLIVIVIVMAAIYSGELFVPGSLVTRHLFVLFPVILVLAARGIEELRVVPRVWVLVASALTGAALIAGVSQYDFRLPPQFTMTWIFGFGITFAGQVAGAAWHALPVFIALAICAAILQFIWFLRHRQRVVVFLLTVFLINAVCLIGVLGAFGQEGATRFNPYNGLGALSQWVMGKIAPAQPLLVMGERGSAQPVEPSLTPDLELLSVQSGFGYSDQELNYLETAGFYDIRMVPQLTLLPAMQLETHANYLLSPIAITGLHTIGQWGEVTLYDLVGTTLAGKIPSTIHYATAQDFYQEALSALAVPATVAVNHQYSGAVQVRNASTASTWRRSGDVIVEVGYNWWYDTGGLVSNDFGVLSPLPSDIAPGQVVTVPFHFQAPSQPGVYLLQVDLTLRQNGSPFANEGGVPIATEVQVIA